MSNSLKAAEITMRVIVIVLQVLAIVGGGLLIGLTTVDSPASDGVGGTAIGVAGIVLLYEILMICLSFMDGLDHKARLLVDIILNSVMAAVTILGTLAIIVLAVLLFIILLTFGAVVVAIFVLPIVFGIMYSVAFIVSAIVAGIIRSKMIRDERPVTIQLQPVVGAAPANVVMVQPPQAQGVGQAYYQPGYVVSVPPNAPGQYGIGAQPPAYSYDPSQTEKGTQMGYGGPPVADAAYPMTSQVKV